MSKNMLAVKGDYELSVGESVEDGQKCYQLMNIITGVVEVETKILPQAYKYLEDLSAGLDAVIALYNEDARPPIVDTTSTEAIVTTDDKVTRIH